ncbi:MAG: hypothetical protein ACOYOO_03285 [Saprospiraceae bacterium]|jgi:hypothetical protein
MLKTIRFILIVGIAFGATAPAVHAQSKNLWTTLGKVTFKKQYDEMLGFKVDVPVFADEVRALNGKLVEIKGYIIPVEGYKNQKEFVFSAFPYNMCFFCGGAGPETVMEVYTRESVKYTAEAIILRGKLELNDSDVNRLMYILNNAEMVRVAE